jgi:phosphatidylserine/phosphatidylglycerophosphate/cardiolipin synthase-like enzyme
VSASDWLLRASERGNDATDIDKRHGDDRAWSTGNQVRAIVHGRPYFAELHERICAMQRGDLLFFTDWRGDPDEQLTDDPGSTLSATLVAASERGVVVRGLLWRSHWRKLGYHSHKHRYLGEDISEAGGQCLRDMRIRPLGSHHQKLVVLRYVDRPEDDIAYVGGIDLCHGRRDDDDHAGDPQALDELATAYGPTPAWHDVHVAVQGPAVHDVETTFRERWDDSVPLTIQPVRRLTSWIQQEDIHPEPLPEQQPPPPPRPDCHSHVQILRTYPRLAPLSYDFAPDGERSVALGNAKAIACARRLVYVEDQFLWSTEVGEHFATALRDQPDLRLIVVLPLVPDRDSDFAEPPQLYGRALAMDLILAAGGDRVAVFGLSNDAGLPIYVHSKTCVIDDRWASVGSDNLNRRSWTFDTEVAAAVFDDRNDGGPAPADSFAVQLRRRLVSEHLGCTPSEVPDDPVELFDLMVARADALDRWFDSDGSSGRHGVRGLVSTVGSRLHLPGRERGRARAARAAGRVLKRSLARGERPPGRLRRLDPPRLTARQRIWAPRAYDVLFDPASPVPEPDPTR